MKPLVSLLTDFGISDPFVAEMKAVIVSICPDVVVVDISHHVERFNIRMGAFILASATPCFPSGSIHLAVVDPGVGSKRRPIAVQTNRSLYVGPDNGLLIPAAIREGIQHVYVLTNRSLMRDRISSTFHGRDIFAPVAAHLAHGTQPKEVGEEIMNHVQLSFAEPKFDRRGATCEVFHIDRFGNVVTNISPENFKKLDLSGTLVLRIHRRRFPVRFVKAYAELRPRDLGALVGSHGFLEIARREASAARKIRARIGDSLQLGAA
jgi:S-adenosylmethionine hydrolase